jgi:hypothetical protein
LAKNIAVQEVTVANAGTTSTSITIERGRIPIAIQTPSALTSTAMTFQASFDGTTFATIQNEGAGSDYSITVAASKFITLKRSAMEGAKYFRLVCGSSEGASRAIQVVVGE